MKCSDEELEQKKQQQKEAQKKVNEKIALYEKARLAKMQEAAKPKQASKK